VIFVYFLVMLFILLWFFYFLVILFTFFNIYFDGYYILQRTKESQPKPKYIFKKCWTIHQDRILNHQNEFSKYVFIHLWNISKHTKLSVSGENILKPPKIEVVGIFPPILKNKKIKNQRKRKGKIKEIYIFIVYITFNIDWWWIVSIFRRWTNNF